MAILFTALVLGLMGSFHCAGMCGPIAIALPLHGNTVPQKIYGSVLYNLGRTLTYGVMGALFGLLGQGVQMIGFQQWVSVIMGSIMIISGIFPVLFKNQYSMEKSMFSFVGKLKSGIAKMFTVRSFRSLFVIGLMNGLLPCGLVYMAIAGAIGTGEVVLGSLYMIFFGLGTIPMMLAISLAGNVLSGAVRSKINKLIPILVVIVGILFVLRGLSLGIPYLSPPREKIEKKFEKSLESEELTSSPENTYNCCSSEDGEMTEVKESIKSEANAGEEVKTSDGVGLADGGEAMGDEIVVELCEETEEGCELAAGCCGGKCGGIPNR